MSIFVWLDNGNYAPSSKFAVVKSSKQNAKNSRLIFTSQLTPVKSSKHEHVSGADQRPFREQLEVQRGKEQEGPG